VLARVGVVVGVVVSGASCFDAVVVITIAVDDDDVVVVVVVVVTPTTTPHADTGGSTACNAAGVAVVSFWCISASFREHG
jgi:hypothetical protein